jgi:hypothetical protein
VAFSVADLNDEVQLRRKLVLTPCATKEGLRRWIRMYLGFDCPDVKVDTDSTGSPLDTIWEIYHSGVTNDPNAPSRYMWYASRDSFKTLGASVLEVLAMLHMKRSVVHMASIEQQSDKAAEYYKRSLDMDALAEFKVGDNKRTVAVVWFEHLPTGDIMTLREWKEWGGRKRIGDYRRHVYYIKVLVNTAQSANSDHVAFMVVDEVDLIRYPKAYREALFIPTTMKTEWGETQPPITLLTSSRKYSGGLVQDEIDNAEERGTAIRHHSILDVTEACPNERHRPDKPKLKVFRSNDTLKTILEDALVPLRAADPKKAETYVEDEAYWGCYHNCKIFAGCRGRLATGQTSDAKALKPTFDTIRKWKEVGDIEMVKAQLLCWKPGNVGAIYSNFSRQANMLTLDEMWKEVIGEAPAAPVTKGQLIEMFMQRGFPAVGGMDFGFTHCFAVVVGFVVGRRLYIVDAFEVPELEPHQCVEVCDRRIKYLNPLLWPDTAYPAYIKMFRSAGYRCREHDKDVVGGIESVRKKIAPAGLEPEMYLIKGDEGCDLLAKRIEGYRWKEDSTGRPTDVPLDVDDDLDDALRYLVQNTFDRSSGVIIAKGLAANVPDELKKAKPAFPTPQQQMAAKIHELTGGESGSTIGMPAMVVLGPGETLDTGSKRLKKGGFFADFS